MSCLTFRVHPEIFLAVDRTWESNYCNLHCIPRLPAENVIAGGSGLCCCVSCRPEASCRTSEQRCCRNRVDQRGRRTRGYGRYRESRIQQQFVGTGSDTLHQSSVTTSGVTYFILRTHTGSGASLSSHRKNSGEDLKKWR